ncbi:MAG TPA: DUF4936 family protein [Burkholderiaceae bacterium]
MSAELYVYYRIAPAAAEAARQAFEAARGVDEVRLLQRNDDTEGDLTWMEIYRSEALAAEPRIAAAMAPFALKGRHIERFHPLCEA